MKVVEGVLNITESDYEEMCDSDTGVCLACCESCDCCEPDTHDRECPKCGKKKVFGMEELAVQSLLNFIEDEDDDYEDSDDDWDDSVDDE